MTTMHHQDGCVQDLAELPPVLMLRVEQRSETTCRIMAWEQCQGCGAQVVYAAGGSTRTSRLIRMFRRDAVPWIATWMHRNTVWGDQPIPGV